MGRVITPAMLAASAAGRYRSAAVLWGPERMRDGRLPWDAYGQLVALGENPSREMVAAVVGSEVSNWTHAECFHDGQFVFVDGPALLLSEECDNGHSAEHLCPRCAALACLSLLLFDLPAGQAADAGAMPPAVFADWIEEPENAREVVSRLAAALRGGAG